MINGIVKNYVEIDNTKIKLIFLINKNLTETVKKIKSILKKRKVPILVGGTGLYFKALVDGLIQIPDIPILLREKIRKYHKKIGQQKFYEELLKLDPKIKNFIFMIYYYFLNIIFFVKSNKF